MDGKGAGGGVWRGLGGGGAERRNRRGLGVAGQGAML